MGIRPVDPKHSYSQLFGTNPAAHQPAGHTGEDIAAPIGTPVVAIADGTVVWADWGTKLPGDDSEAGWISRFYLSKAFCGIAVVIEHDDCWTLFSHLNETHLNNFQKVKQGELIGRVGNTGFSTGPHLHWEVIPKNPNWNNGFYGRINPAPYRTEAYYLGTKPVPTVEPQSVVTPLPVPVPVPVVPTPKPVVKLGQLDAQTVTDPIGGRVGPFKEVFGWRITRLYKLNDDRKAEINQLRKELDDLKKEAN